MSSKPKASEYQKTQAQKDADTRAIDTDKYYEENYAPILREMRDTAATEDLQGMAKGVANADTMQALTSRPTLAATQSVDAAADLASAGIGQQVQAIKTGLATEQGRKLDVLRIAKGEQNQALTGLASVARISAGEALNEATNKQYIRNAKGQALGKVAGTIIGQGMANLGSGTDATFFKPQKMMGATPASRLDIGKENFKDYFSIPKATSGLA
jgi:hypothetical protein